MEEIMRLSTVLLCLFSFLATVSAQIADHVVISEVYGGGGNSGATYKNDFIELYNPTASPVDLTGWSVQYASATGSSWQRTTLTGSIPAYGFYLIQEAAGGGGTMELPVPDDSGNVNLNAINGKVALVGSDLRLTDSIPVPSSYVDYVGYGNATGYEGTGPAPAISVSKSAERKAQFSSTAATMAPGGADASFGNGCDTDNNGTDFVAQLSVNPQNSSSPIERLNDSSLPVRMGVALTRVEFGKVVLEFSTESEVDLLGFNILRAPDSTGPYVLISGFAFNPSLKASGENNAGALYSFTDAKVEAGKTYWYSIKCVGSSGKVEQAGEVLAVSITDPESFQVFQNFPNPFNPVTSISYQLNAPAHVSLRVFDVTGRQVAVLVDALQPAGAHSAVFNGAGFASGVYVYRLESEFSPGYSQSVVRKMLLVK